MPDDPHTPREHPVMQIASWAALVGSFVLSAATWIVIGDVAGFNITVGQYTLYFAIGLPLVVDAYIVCALIAWVHPTSELVERFAKYNAYGSALIGWVAQAVYHCAAVWAATHTPWKAVLAFVVGGLPPAAAFLGVHLRAMSRRDLDKQSISVNVMAERIQEPVAPTPVAPPLQDAPSLAIPPPSVIATPPHHRTAPVRTPQTTPTPRLASTPVRGGQLREGYSNSRKRKVTPEVEARIRGLWEQGLTLQEVMKRSGYKRSTCIRIKTAKDEVERENRERVAS